ncbi:MAG: hypothetical protein A2177_14630 [Spirochaetes bacterium RBG_13_68_11]|nr:MAG: hypothetical protein A2177_14630 [Spirochaetes bacterium RBG_13_68_11]
MGICHSFADDGRCISLLEVLLTNACGIADLAGLPPELRGPLSKDCDPSAEDLWRRYFAAIANPERRNPRLQRKLMPVRYREFMVERPGQ